MMLLSDVLKSAWQNQEDDLTTQSNSEGTLTVHRVGRHNLTIPHLLTYDYVSYLHLAFTHTQLTGNPLTILEYYQP